MTAVNVRDEFPADGGKVTWVFKKRKNIPRPPEVIEQLIIAGSVSIRGANYEAEHIYTLDADAAARFRHAYSTVRMVSERREVTALEVIVESSPTHGLTIGMVISHADRKETGWYYFLESKSGDEKITLKFKDDKILEHLDYRCKEMA